MNNNSGKAKLILVEGIPGSGKSTLSQYIHDTLDAKGKVVDLFLEGNLQHPADYESVACIPTLELDKLRKRYIDVFKRLEPFVTENGDDSLFAYALARQSVPDEIPNLLYEEIQRYEIYDGVSVEKYGELLSSRWRSFTHNQQKKENVVILECCFLQNPGCAMLARHNAGDDRLMQHVLQIAGHIKELEPVLFYLNPDDVGETIARVKATRAKEWLDFVIWYHTDQAYGRNKGLKGYEGYIKFLEYRQKVELKIIEKLPFESYVINQSDYDWDKQQQIISSILMKYT